MRIDQRRRKQLSRLSSPWLDETKSKKKKLKKKKTLSIGSFSFSPFSRGYLSSISAPVTKSKKAMRLRQFAALVAAVLLVLACCSRCALAQDEESSIVPPPVPTRRSKDAVVTNSTSSRGAVKAIADCGSNANGTITVIGVGHSSGAPDVARVSVSFSMSSSSSSSSSRRRLS